MKYTNICKYCKKEFKAKQKRKRYCSLNCQKICHSHKVYSDNVDHVECKICKFRAKQLLQHVEKLHDMSVEEYCEKYNLTRQDLTMQSLRKQMSTNILKACKEGRCGWQKGSKNPSQSKEAKSGRYSAWSMNFKGYDGLVDEEKEQRISELANKVADIRDKNSNNSLRIDYYTSRGYSEEEAKQLLSERQATFSLDICIEKHGKKEGTRIFNERQEKWQNTLNSKPIEEIERINKSKANQVYNIVSYSKISQELFNEIYDKIKNKYSEIYYATLENNNIENRNENFEYEVLLPNGINRYFLDFYVKDNNKVIEFDGDYWHGKRPGNKERDRIREKELKSLGFVNIFRVKERDFKNDPEKVINECIEFIKN